MDYLQSNFNSLKKMKKSEGAKMLKKCALLVEQLKNGNPTAKEIKKAIRSVKDQITILKDAYNKASK